ncbi:MAG: hypothetical protein VYD77_01255 [Actinomycetota bacterium]|nr:hypothetical protein [Actinomycetota bacterium]
MIDVERRAELNQAKLNGLLKKTFPDEVFEPIYSKSGSIFSNGKQRFLYAPDERVSPLVIALATETDELQTNLVVDKREAVLLQQTHGLSAEITLWIVDNDRVVQHPDSVIDERREINVLSEDFKELLKASGCDVVQEHGVLKGEIKGLEVARVVINDEGQQVLRVGVGAYDQEAHKIFDSQQTPEEKLFRIVSQVMEYRNQKSEPHPLNRAARAKWMIAEIIATSENFDLEEVQPLSMLEEIDTVTESHPAAAIGRTGAGSVLIVASSGIDLQTIPVAAGLLVSTGAEEIWIALSPKDRHPAIINAARYLKAPSRFIEINEPWPK